MRDIDQVIDDLIMGGMFDFGFSLQLWSLRLGSLWMIYGFGLVTTIGYRTYTKRVSRDFDSYVYMLKYWI